MAKASFHKNQRVFVRPVGTWAIIERVLPQWVKGLDEPLKVHYDVGLGREFAASELLAETNDAINPDDFETERWRVARIRNRWREANEAANHPVPGTYPVVLTDEKDWGGWRVPIAEYDRDPARIEYQARLIEAAPQLMRLATVLVETASDNAEELPAELLAAAREAKATLRRIYDTSVSSTARAAE